jgi:hypothetical protein
MRLSNQAERDDIQKEYNGLKKEFDTLRGELAALRSTYNAKSDDWIKEKLDFQHRMKDLEESIRCSAGEGWDSERERFKQVSMLSKKTFSSSQTKMSRMFVSEEVFSG